MSVLMSSFILGKDIMLPDICTFGTLSSVVSFEKCVCGETGDVWVGGKKSTETTVTEVFPVPWRTPTTFN